MITLYPHQKEGSRRVLEHEKYCLFFEVGTGKTFTVLDALSKLPKGKVLISAPKRVLERVWIKESKDPHFNISHHDVTYMNYERISRDKNFKKNRFDYIICDEVHRLKGRSSKVSKVFRNLSKSAKYVWGLTGTPIANNYVDIYHIFKALDIKEFSNMNYDEFVFTYYYTKQLESERGIRFQILINAKPFMVKELLDRIGKHSMTLKAEDCIKLPPVEPEIVEVKGMNTPKYKEIKEGIMKTPDYEKTMTKLETVNKLRQAANGFYYDAFGDTHIFKDNAKFKVLKDDLKDLLEETNKVVIVYYYKQDLEQLKQLEYTYTLDSQEFEDNPDCQILFIQYSQSEGLNLQYVCNVMLFYTYDHSFLNFDQMKGRIRREGQKKTVIFKIYKNVNTIEENVWKAIENKESTDQYLKGVLGSVEF